ncbi:Hypothetical protein PFR_JS12-1_1391 [Propionibacterium freudenreichii]|uniref:hypothetical protein n=1 Tax=Propionibacterium freudenreichii TaxID=1744 RepID=UPI000BC325C5|nr:hypothetical protein [Propionibacterium freudenreichii]SBN95773.1 Hypothetical protein PFR_JS12-2_1389 [Propionibacterium freudenreichii]SCC97359.1 Hypothetical protein PFR_JS12-1_1391 [Propionibacterium freudenreichii]
MAYKIVMQYPDGDSEEQDEVFDTEAQAVDYAGYLVSCYDLGGEVLNMSNPGDYPLSEEEADYEIIEVDD